MILIKIVIKYVDIRKWEGLKITFLCMMISERILRRAGIRIAARSSLDGSLEASIACTSL